MKGRKKPPRTEEHCKKLSLSNKGQKRSLEVCQKISLAKTGTKRSLFKKAK
jgi:hypothetical protein